MSRCGKLARGRPRERVSLGLVAVGGSRGPSALGALALLAEAAAFFSSRGKAAVDAVLVLAAADPVDLGVCLDHGARRIHEDDLVPLVLPVGPYPVGVKDLEVLVPLLGSLLGHPLEAFRDDELLLPLPLGAPSGVDAPFPEGPLPDLGANEDVSLLGLVDISSYAVAM